MKRTAVDSQQDVAVPFRTILVQAIETQWTKASRGAPAATHRNRVPEAVDLPAALPDLGERSYVLQHVVYSESDGFQAPWYKPVTATAAMAAFHFACIRVAYAHQFVRVDFEWYSVKGVPRRPEIHDRHTLQPGQWGRVRANGRFSFDDTWGYFKWIINIGFFAQVPTNVFTTTNPVFKHSHMADLW